MYSHKNNYGDRKMNYIISLSRNKGDTRRLKKIANKQRGNLSKHVYYLDTNAKKIYGKVKDNDSLQIHGHGMPWCIGGVEADSKYDRTPFTLATDIHKILKGNTTSSITIDLLSCFSGCIVKPEQGTKGLPESICYARELSAELARLGYHDITVYGYVGAMNENFKSVGPYSESRSKSQAKLDDARVIYKDGKLVQKANKDILSKQDYLDLTFNESQLSEGFTTAYNNLYPKPEANQILPPILNLYQTGNLADDNMGNIFKSLGAQDNRNDSKQKENKSLNIKI